MENHTDQPIVVLDRNYLRVSGDLSGIVRDVASLYTQYNQALVAQENQSKDFTYFKENVLKYIQNIKHSLNRAVGLLNSGIVIGEDVALKTLMSHLAYHVGYGTDLVVAMENHLLALVEPQPKPLPEGELTIEHILDIFDGKHPLYVMIKNKIKDVSPRSMCYEYSQRMSFKLKHDDAGQKFYVDYTTNYMPGDSEGREYLNDQIDDGAFEDETFTIKVKKLKKP